METRKKRYKNLFILLFPLVLLYYEIVFRAFTVGGIFRLRSLLLIPLCCAYGGIGYILATLTKSRRANYWITVALLFLTALPYGVEAFIYREFKIFFNMRAIAGGTGDVLTTFSGEVLRLIFSVRGIACIVLFLLPTVLYLFLGTAPKAIGGRARWMALARTVAFYVIGVLIIHAAPTLSRLYGDEYSFNAAIERFGLVTGMQLEVRQSLFGRNTFQDVDIMEALATPEPEVTPEITPEPVDYGFNEMDLPLDDPFGTATDEIRQLNNYVAGLTPSSKNEFTGRFAGKNLILITAEAFTK